MHTCSRHWEAEAVRDGRLSGPEMVSFVRHAASCPACSARVASLDGFRASLRELPAPPRDVFTARRSRRAILQRLDEQQLRPERRPIVTRMVWVAGLVAVAMALGLWVRSSRAPVAVPVVQALSVEVVPRGHAVWSERHTGSRRELHLESGEILVRVANKSRLDELVLLTPDAEIEDIGTVFSVRVEGGATREVHVDEGAVNIHRHGVASQIVRAGGHWVAPAVWAVSSASAVPGLVPLPSPALTPAPAVVPAEPSPSPPHASVSAAPGTRGRHDGAAVLPASAASREDDRAAEFERAMRLFRAGQLTTASADFDAFVLHHPRDPRAEDAAYLSVVALARSGQRSAAQRAAASYLARYPNGLRAREVEGLVR